MTPNKKIIYHSFLHGLGDLKLANSNVNDNYWSTLNNLEAGFIFAPYIPLFEDSSEFIPRRSLRSRYTQRDVNNSFYDIIEHDGA